MGVFGTHIAHLRNFAGITQKQLADRIGTGVTTIKNIESGYVTAPIESLVEKIASVFGVDSSALMNHTSLDVEERGKMIYVVSCVSSDKPFIEADKIVETVFVDRDQLRGYDYMGMKISDNAMIDAHICPGASVIVRQNAVVKNGDIVLAVCHNLDGIVRRYFKEGSKIILKAENSSGLYPDISIDEDKDRFFLMGKVVTTIQNIE